MKLQNILYDKIKLPSGDLIEKKKLLLKNYLTKTIFQRNNKLFDWSKMEDLIWTWDKNNLPKWARPPNRVSSSQQPLNSKKVLKRNKNVSEISTEFIF